MRAFRERDQSCGGVDLMETLTETVLHMDNAPVHVAVLALAFHGKQDIDLLQQLAYSPDLAPCDFWAKLSGRRFRNVD